MGLFLKMSAYLQLLLTAWNGSLTMAIPVIPNLKPTVSR
jgi:hypothetical protein